MSDTNDEKEQEALDRLIARRPKLEAALEAAIVELTENMEETCEVAIDLYESGAHEEAIRLLEGAHRIYTEWKKFDAMARRRK